MPTYAIIDDSDPRLVWNGNWHSLADPVNPRAPHYNGTASVTNDPEATVSFSFQGSLLSVFGTIDTPNTKQYPGATFSVSPNAVLPTRLSSESLLPMIPVGESIVATTHLRLFTTDLMAMGDYKMSIKTDGVWAGGPSFYLDFLVVQIPDEVQNPGDQGLLIVDDDDSRWAYTTSAGEWATGSGSGTYMNTSQLTTMHGGMVTLEFEGTDISVYGSLMANFNSSLPIGYFQVDQGDPYRSMATSLPNFAALRNGSELRHQKVFAASGLSPGQHTLDVVIPAFPTQLAASGVAFIPWALDYAVFGTPPLSSQSSTTPAPSPPVIVGAVLGAISFLAIFSIITILLWRRKRRSLVIVVDDAKTNGGISLTTPLPSPPAPPAVSPRENLRRMFSTHKQRGRGTSQPQNVGSGSSHQSSEVFSVIPESQSGSRTAVQETPRRVPAEGSRNAGGTRFRREVDGGVRLISLPDDVEEKTDIHPPSYHQ
ncbi:hypothetical protein M408DRAFT_103924 [Serendipita vermifera MAFF 305830]|uniref:Uncharacterized protein n=1 Tax=Serendipita vermifera MAFF 305830 TaxID=933852 RepID=A0A0C2WVK0_SERVB|nr:hypothetical protein M408DRAFT_103924 [Serendipita vermifera MAFF 305830]